MPLPLPPILLGLMAPARAAPSLAASERWLATDYVAVGVAADASLGNPDAGLGLIFDPDGPSGAFPPGGDVLLPGRVFETWAVETADATWVQAAPDGGSDLVLGWDPPEDDGRLTWLHGAVGDSELAVDAWVVLPWGQPLAWLVVELVPQRDLDEVWIGRSFDPDIDSPLDGSSRTSNSVADGVVVASGSVDGRAWALASPGGQGGICSWCSLPSDITAGSEASEGDQQPGVAVHLGDLAAGDRVRVLFAHGFGVDAAMAMDAAIEGAASADLDGDGAEWTEDCDDLDGSRSPLADEQPDNGRDDDCDGLVDEVEGDEGGPQDSGWSGRDDWDTEIPGGESGDAAAETAPRRSGGCSQLGDAPVAMGLLLYPLLLLRRRP